MPKIYSIFYQENRRYYPVLSQNRKYWLGGTRTEYLIFKTKAEAQKELRKIKKQNLPFSLDGVFEIKRVKLTT